MPSNERQPWSTRKRIASGVMSALYLAVVIAFWVLKGTGDSTAVLLPAFFVLALATFAFIKFVK